jgi:hypothetical protein
MNERIRELAEQANASFGERLEYAVVFGEMEDFEKFAFLIIQECARIAIQKQTENDVNNIVSENPAKDFAYAMIEHFGVK